MTPRTMGSLVVCAGLVFGLAGAGSKEPAREESTRLIESIQGAPLYTAYCAVCHGQDGKGAGPMARSLKFPPLDLTKITERTGGAFPLKRVQKIIAGEEEIAAGHGTRAMPVWGPVFSQVAWDQDLGRIRVYNLAKYIETLQTR